MLRILVLAHDLADDSVHKRVAMLSAGGAAVTVAGFRRTPDPVGEIAGHPAVDLGRTRDAAFGQRAWAVVRQMLRRRRYRELFENVDVILARNLEMLAVAVSGQSICKSHPAIVYESLDIHHLLLRQGIAGSVLRTVERRLARNASAIVTSSPAFISNYFEGAARLGPPVRLVENKVFADGGAPEVSNEVARPPGPPWIVGWFGHIRCNASLRILTDLVRRSAGGVQVVVRGKPALDQFEDFYASVAQTPGLRFLGPYKNPDDLAAMYGGVHFTWAIDMFDPGMNSIWCLPNRIYEGGLFGSVPIAAASMETGHFLRRLGIGVILDEPFGEAFAAFLDGLTPERYRELEDAVLRVPPVRLTRLLAGKRSLSKVQRIRGLSSMLASKPSIGLVNRIAPLIRRIPNSAKTRRALAVSSMNRFRVSAMPTARDTSVHIKSWTADCSSDFLPRLTPVSPGRSQARS